MTGPEEKTTDCRPPEDALDQALLRFPLADRAAWRTEALRLGEIVSEYARINPKRRRNPKTGLVLSCAFSGVACRHEPKWPSCGIAQ
jgi:hypothetical protein